jgi:NAD(P)-dependent dehydrogenase (short-subunit alcohol dehydrogenase family)
MASALASLTLNYGITYRKPNATKTFEQIGARLPVGRVGKPEDIADAYVYLMQSGFSTGETIILDGGALLS